MRIGHTETMMAHRTFTQLRATTGISIEWLFLLWVCCLLAPVASFGQEYGLEFASQPTSKDKRTKLDLNPEGYYSFHGDFELSFNVQIRGLQPSTFGYIARIVDVEGRNIDVIFDGPKSHSLHVVYGHALTSISVPDNAPGIYDHWTELRLKYNIKDKTLRFSTPDTSILQGDVDFSGKVKIFFGRNDYKPVQTTDVPRMNIKDIRIYQKGRCLHHFPLDEMAGNGAKDIISNKTATVQNPEWIRPRFYRWEWSFDTRLSGPAAICYDPGTESVYMVGEKQMKIFALLKDSITDIVYSNTFSELIRGSQVFYDTLNKRLICYNLKTKIVYRFNFPERTWQKISDGREIPDRFWFHNKFYSESEGILYVFGGYSQHTYYNLVQKYDFTNNQWDTIEPIGEAFHPRMHAAIGHFADTLFIIGGYGTRAGNQILNPEHYTDLLAFSLNDRRFTRKYNFLAPMEDLDFAHSMVINEEDGSYYVLASNIFEYETYLQLLKGNLSDPGLVKVGNTIPYKFHNENSFSDLFYSSSSRELIAATSLLDAENNETKISVYTISFPPYISEPEPDGTRNLVWQIIFAALFLLIVVTSASLLVKNIRKKKRSSNIGGADPLPEKTADQLQSQNGMSPNKPKKSANTILFFGGFQVINQHGDDITKKFTPLLKELFLLIFLHSIKDKGISVPRLTELLWFSMDAKTAKNNRAVNIAKLKNLLSEIDSCTISRRTSYWQLEFDEAIVYNDYWSCMKNLDQGKLMSKEVLLPFLSIIKKGPLLGNASYEWLDEFKLECSNQIIDSLSHFIDQEKIETDPELMIQVADAILIFDMMHEEAIGIKCRALTTLGKHSLAREIFAKFLKDYQTLYDEPFNRSFTDIIKH